MNEQFEDICLFARRMQKRSIMIGDHLSVQQLCYILDPTY